MSDEVLKVVVVCITLVFIAIIILIGYIIATKNYYGDSDRKREIQIMRQGLDRMQKQCNDMYVCYRDLVNRQNQSNSQ